MNPTVGRIVHYVERRDRPTCRAAIVAHVHSAGVLNLTVCTETGATVGVTSVPAVDGAAEGYDGPTWHWPEREEPANEPVAKEKAKK